MYIQLMKQWWEKYGQTSNDGSTNIIVQKKMRKKKNQTRYEKKEVEK